MKSITGFAVCLILLLLLHATPSLAADDSLVTTVRVPDGGIQPQAATDSNGRLHLIYFKGDPAHGDVFYVHSDDDGRTFSKPLRVNSQAGSAVAIGTVRGAQLALGHNGRMHVAWMGSDKAEPKVNGRQTPMLYSRLSDAGDAFEPQRNLIREHPGLDGGGSIAADRTGDVYVAWHAPETRKGDEADRHVWLVRSTDDGKTFGDEIDMTPTGTGACGCCGMRLAADDHGDVFALYRSATQMVHRDIYLLVSHDHGQTTTATKVGPWQIGACVMSTAALSDVNDGGTVAAWEQQGNIVTGTVSPDLTLGQVVPAPGAAANRKHPAIAINRQGSRLVAWTEGTGWAKGGRVAWQLYDREGKPVDGARGSVSNLPAWDLPATAATRDGRFIILY